ncbi:MAG: RidA family protein, partial [Gaiellaceae bacterium]
GGVGARPAIDLAQRLHDRDTIRIERRHVSSGSALEDRFGYSRAVRVGPQVWVAGTAPIMPDDSDPPPDPYGQAKRCLEIVEGALREAGGGLEHAVRTRLLMTDASFAPEILRAHGDAFGETRPACTGVVVGLLDSRWLVEIEVDAVLPE